MRSKDYLSLGVAGILMILGATSLYVEQVRPGAGPPSAVRFHVDALTRADLDDLQKSATGSVYLGYQTQASRPVYAAVVSLLQNKIPSLAYPHWRDVRNEARAAAAVEYQELREEIVSIGRTRYQGLSPEERRRIIESGGFDRFVVIKGIEGLAPAKRERVPDPAAYYRHEDRGSYVDRQAWRHVSADERALMESPRALDDADTPEKLNYFDKIAKPMLTAEEQALLVPVARRDASSLESFVSAQGERLLRERLTKDPPSVQGLDQLTCISPAFEAGSLLHGPASKCTAGGDSPTFLLMREQFRWRVADVAGLTVGQER